MKSAETLGPSASATGAHISAAPSQKERVLLQKINKAFARGQGEIGTRHAAQFLKDFPQSKEAKSVSDKVLKVLTRLSRKKDQNSRFLKKKVFELAQKSSPAAVAYWGYRLFWRKHYNEALLLSGSVPKKDDKRPEALMIAARSALFVGKYPQSMALFDELLSLLEGNKKLDESELYQEALFRSGLVHFRSTKYKKAQKLLSELVNDYPKSNYSLRGQYWLWQSQKSLGLRQADKTAAALVKRYPLTYYGLRIQAQRQKKRSSMATQTQKICKGHFYSEQKATSHLATLSDSPLCSLV